MIGLNDKCFYCDEVIIILKIEMISTEYGNPKRKTDKEIRRELWCNGSHKTVIYLDEKNNNNNIVKERY